MDSWPCLRTWCSFSYLECYWEVDRSHFQSWQHKYPVQKQSWEECCHWRFLEKIRAEIHAFPIQDAFRCGLICAILIRLGEVLNAHFNRITFTQVIGAVQPGRWWITDDSDSRGAGLVTPFKVSWFEIAVKAPKAKRISASALGVSLFREDRSAKEGDDGSSSSEAEVENFMVLLLRLWMNCSSGSAACNNVLLFCMDFDSDMLYNNFTQLSLPLLSLVSVSLGLYPRRIDWAGHYKHTYLSYKYCGSITSMLTTWVLVRLSYYPSVRF